MKTIPIFRLFVVIFVILVFTSCTEYLTEKNNTQGERIGLSGRVNVMNEKLATAKSRTGSDLLAPAIHTSTVSGGISPSILDIRRHQVSCLDRMLTLRHVVH